MKQKTVSRLLITAGALAAAGILILSLFYAPALAAQCRDVYSQTPGIGRLYWLGLTGVWIASLILLLALGEYFRVSLRIGREQSFCRENVKGLRRIAAYLAADGALWLLAVFLPGFCGVPVGPAWIAFVLAAAAHFALSLLAGCLGQLLARAVEIKRENDLTV